MKKFMENIFYYKIFLEADGVVIEQEAVYPGLL